MFPLVQFDYSGIANSQPHLRQFLLDFVDSAHCCRPNHFAGPIVDNSGPMLAGRSAGHWDTLAAASHHFADSFLEAHQSDLVGLAALDCAASAIDC